MKVSGSPPSGLASFNCTRCSSRHTGLAESFERLDDRDEVDSSEYLDVDGSGSWPVESFSSSLIISGFPVYFLASLQLESEQKSGSVDREMIYPQVARNSLVQLMKYTSST